jgi:hypothetical protein
LPGAPDSPGAPEPPGSAEVDALSDGADGALALALAEGDSFEDWAPVLGATVAAGRLALPAGVLVDPPAHAATIRIRADKATGTRK